MEEKKEWSLDWIKSTQDDTEDATAAKKAGSSGLLSKLTGLLSGKKNKGK